MELIPIFSTVMLISAGLFVVVLVVSFTSSRKVKPVKHEDFREIVRQRRLAHSLEQQAYYNRIAARSGQSFNSESPDRNSGNVLNNERNTEPDKAENSETSQKQQINYYQTFQNERLFTGKRYSILNPINRPVKKIINKEALQTASYFDFSKTS